jgi:hypothetical protein
MCKWTLENTEGAITLEDKFCYEKIHNKFGKYILGLKKIACNISAKSELGRFPITHYQNTSYTIQVIYYFLNFFLQWMFYRGKRPGEIFKICDFKI